MKSLAHLAATALLAIATTFAGQFAALLASPLIGPAAGTAQAAGEELGLFRYGGLDYSAADLPPHLRQAVYEAQLAYFQRLRDIAAEAALDLHRAEGGEEARAALDVARPDDALLRQFYEENKARIGQPFEGVREQLADFLHARASQARRAEVLGELQAERQYTLLLRAPTPPVMAFDTTGYPYRGSDDAQVTLVEFADFQCPHCKRAAAVLKRLEDEYGERVRFVYLDFPVNRSGISRLVALGGVCAHEQDRFWDYHDAAFEAQSRLTAESPRQLAEQLELEMEAFDACLASQRPEARVAAAEAQGERAGVRATPTLFVDGRRVEAEQLERDLRRALDAALDGAPQG